MGPRGHLTWAVILYSYNPTSTRPDRGLQKLPLLLRPLQRSLHTNLRLPRVHAILKRQVLAANHKRVYRGTKVHGLLLDPPHQHW